MTKQGSRRIGPPEPGPQSRPDQNVWLDPLPELKSPPREWDFGLVVPKKVELLLAITKPAMFGGAIHRLGKINSTTETANDFPAGTKDLLYQPREEVQYSLHSVGVVLCRARSVLTVGSLDGVGNQTFVLRSDPFGLTTKRSSYLRRSSRSNWHMLWKRRWGALPVAKLLKWTFRE